MTQRPRAGIVAVLLAAALSGHAQTLPAADAPSAPSTPAVEIRHCAGGPPLTIGAGDARAVLDDEERDTVLAEMLARFPILVRDSFAPPVILLWRKPPDDLYVSLRPGGFSDGTACATATFVARIFRITPTLTAKYFATPP